MSLLSCDGASLTVQYREGLEKEPRMAPKWAWRTSRRRAFDVELAFERLRVFGDEVGDVVDHRIRQAAGMTHERAAVGFELQAALALGAGDDLQQLRIERHGGVYTTPKARPTGF
jgi:hypothetical protein